MYTDIIDSLRPPRSSTTTPIFQCTVNYRPGMGKQTFGDCEINLVSLQASKTGHDLSLDIIDDPKGATQLALITRRHMYQEQEGRTLLRSLEALVQAFAFDSQLKLAEVGPYDPGQVQRALSLGTGKWHRFRHRFQQGGTENLN